MSAPQHQQALLPPPPADFHHPLIDSHVHLDAFISSSSTSAESFHTIIKRAREHHVEKAVCVAQTLAECKFLIEAAEQHPSFIYAAAGIHPVSYSLLPPSQRQVELQGISEFIRQHHEKFVCLGEIGLDFSPWILQQASEVERKESEGAAAVGASNSSAASLTASADWKSSLSPTDDAAQRAIQIDLFRAQVRLGLKYGLPLNVHSRNASKYVLQVLLEESDAAATVAATTIVTTSTPSTTLQSHFIGVLLHAFDGSLATLKLALSRGYYFSATTSLIRDEQMKKVIYAVMKEGKRVEYVFNVTSVLIPSVLLQLVLETDSPALHPIKQPPSSSTSASSSSSACCTPENNQPANLYIALLIVYEVYCHAEKAYQDELSAKSRKKAEYAAKQANGTASTITTAGSTSSLISSAPSPSLSVNQFASILYQNTLRLFPRLK